MVPNLKSRIFFLTLCGIHFSYIGIWHSFSKCSKPLVVFKASKAAKSCQVIDKSKHCRTKDLLLAVCQGIFWKLLKLLDLWGFGVFSPVQHICLCFLSFVAALILLINEEIILPLYNYQNELVCSC